MTLIIHMKLLVEIHHQYLSTVFRLSINIYNHFMFNFMFQF